MLKRVDLAMLPVEALAMQADAFIVVDVLRASTTIATLFHRGLADMLVFDDIDAAREAARRDGRLLFGEVGGLPPEGFDHGNSPLEAQTADVEGRGAVLFTTNGTTALCALGDHATVYAGAPANASALLKAIRQHERVAIVCAGTDGARRFALEDFAAAGLMVQAFHEAVGDLELGDAAALAERVVGRPDSPTAWIHASGTGTEGRKLALPSPGQQMLMSSEHALRLRSIGLERDLPFCAQLDTSRAVPMVAGCGPGWALLRDQRSEK